MSRKGNPECDYKGYTDAYETAIEEITAFVEKHKKIIILISKIKRNYALSTKVRILTPTVNSTEYMARVMWNAMQTV